MATILFCFNFFSIILQLSGIGFINLRKERSTTVNYVKVYGIYTHLPILTEKSIRIYLKCHNEHDSLSTNTNIIFKEQL